ncbi:PspC domain-containing protein [Tindallia californiensis]|uniref:Phage shock protein PspC (Stress-responsive transcriptional regulator) n=1 Tax=Tindallia californiensis TaxID=159292 RepID=A0A1H3K1Y9_9FIRM|nr:PspC domain-containing protein [Tindallia californiensis]SDY46207.1 Phage shock protein PspC (stress-responsive transcriptional regulator) [Tindallia californiensis]
MKRLYLSRTNKKISGVCGGIAEYFNIDPTLVRLIWVVFTVFSMGFGGIIAYIIALAIIPEPPISE